ncbi:MAG: CpsB/CapC family capsule biosynthesis tyrosine phosphatase [Gemmatimonadota bacterium]|nr:CpsB/CapC family capsule biosynthesis tyrosine phosphatase [Gemmatimonadota bacterium]
MVDLHTHVLPGVDDGARDMDEALAALERLIDEGASKVVATPHYRASLRERTAHEAATLRRFDEAFERLTGAVAEAGFELELARGCEFRLDAPGPDPSDPRLRLGGSRWVLVEFASFQVPPYAGGQLAAVREAGWSTLLAHPERYAGLGRALERVEAWVSDGTRLQVNARSLLGGYGPAAEDMARELLRRGWVSCIASDYHARGAPALSSARGLLEGGDATSPDRSRAIHALFSENPARILADEEPLSVPAIELPDVDRRASRRWPW